MMQFIGINDGFNAEDEEKKKKIFKINFLC